MTSRDGGAAPNPIGFDDRLLAICAAACAEFGDPPCWQLPDLVDPCEPIAPCANCLALAADNAAKDAEIARLKGGLTTIHASLRERQERLGEEFEAAIFDDLESLYED
ncbi:hypothetical protein GTF97_08175 [Roseobacter sp. HKCCD8767]|uniref:hypothetical protein n=1 Tax=unclassified Roseobacter TaxID=196798 RepID=UPI00149305DE|nr:MULTISPECIES: hypothetical protein [unclassified Roseobacter]MBF9050608.1 hypothetical protein [Rhodobacterales bacterium HKCCD4356]NNV26216.1 hypothetical protein [Roseobacter sp. HKCCD8192]NNV43642.1 hypothetical protein [Roseobacter sp. HKCCD6497]NNV64528.1 hypothetical protein [Roseobacter sp. HKCCD8434]NNV68790.1 hypothetical protein [Roseobacter sp. HKCCD8474]NNW07113.1 hypothetical protein [Roseobacter sp. HKCCD8431]NNW11371.1 hypothetical protein [Roseobacter sp. HKCCD8484]NNW156